MDIKEFHEYVMGDVLGGVSDVTSKRMFGGYGIYKEGIIFAIITDEKRHVKMAIVDKHTTPVLSVNDPSLMVGMPASLTAATGIDALTHAIEAYVSTAATPITDAVALKAIELIQAELGTAATQERNPKGPDFNGDGKVSPLELQKYQQLQRK